MEPRSLEYIRAAMSGRLIGSGATRANGISTDSRTVGPGDCFIALAGEKFDGHDFVAEVVKKGAAAVVVNTDRFTNFETPSAERTASPLTPAVAEPLAGRPALSPLRGEGEEPGAALIAVTDTQRALGELGARYRSDFTLPVVAVAGSNGKTTTKELLAAVLRQKFATLWSEASFNNDIGVPLTILKLEKKHAAAVFEIGTNHPGELAPLIKMVKPEIGVITSIGREHLEFFGSVAAVAEEEGTLAELLPPSGTLFINGDSEWAEPIARRCKGEVVRVGRDPANDWRAEKVELHENGITFRAQAPVQQFSGEYSLPLLGAHQAINALLTIAVAAKLGVSAEQARRGLAEAKPPKMRLQMWECNGVRVLDDSYNANADSMLAALQTLHDFPGAYRRIAVLGDMAELGEQTKAAHVEVGARAAELGLAQVFTVGVWAEVTAEAARAKGMTGVSICRDAEAVIAEVKKFVRAGDLLLIKASRAAGLERVSAAFRTVQ